MSLELKNVSFAVKGKAILNDISFKIEPGEFVSLLGASGAGKTTTIKIIAGILEQTAGAVFIDNEQIDRLPAYKRKVSVAFQDMRLFPHMTVGKNVGFPLKMQGMDKKERSKRVDYYLELVRMKGFAGRRVDEISGGQQQRVALARAVAASPRVLLLDEPFSGLDENLRDGMRSMVRELHNELGMTTAMITHNAIEALTMSDRIIYMQDGRVVQHSTSTELYYSPKTPAAALCFGNALDIVGTVRDGVFLHSAVKFPAECADGPATAVLRYEGIRLQKQPDSEIEVRSCLFSGEWYQVTLAFKSESLTLTTKDPIEVGSRVTLAPEPNSYFVFPDAAAAVDGH